MCKSLFKILLLFCCSINLLGKGESTWQFLKIGGTGKVISMGNSYSPLDNGTSSIYYNPAGLSYIEVPECSFTYFNWFADTTYNTIFLAVPFLYGGVGLGSLFFDNGDFEEYSEDGLPTGIILNSKDFALLLSYGKNIKENFSVGANFKYVQSFIMYKNIIGLACDIGLIYKKKNKAIGVCLQNFGVNIKKLYSNENLPFLLNLQSGYNIEILKKIFLNFSLSSRIEVVDKLFKINTGLEWQFWDTLFLKAGYRLFDNIVSWNAGIGFKYVEPKERFSLVVDYGFLPLKYFSPVHIFSLSVKYYPEKAEIYKEKIKREPPIRLK